MLSVGVVAHQKKTLGGGLPELRAALALAGVNQPIWYEVGSSRQVPKRVRQCIKQGVNLLIAWGGDGTVQRSMDALVKADAGRQVDLAIIPAGTANLLATILDIPADVSQAVAVALRGHRRRLDVGEVQGEHFAVMAGTGFDALMIRAADRGLKDHLGRFAYLWTGLKNLGNKGVGARIKVDGKRWYKGPASCILIGNVGTLLGGVQAFPQAQPDDGVLDVGVVQADSFWGWLKVLTKTAVGQAATSPLVCMTQARKVAIRMDGRLPYQLDGGSRKGRRRLVVRVKPAAVTVCVP